MNDNGQIFWAISLHPGGLRITGGMSLDTGQFFRDMTVSGGISVRFDGLQVTGGTILLLELLPMSLRIHPYLFVFRYIR